MADFSIQESPGPRRFFLLSVYAGQIPSTREAPTAFTLLGAALDAEGCLHPRRGLDPTDVDQIGLPKSVALWGSACALNVSQMPCYLEGIEAIIANRGG